MRRGMLRQSLRCLRFALRNVLRTSTARYANRIPRRGHLVHASRDRCAAPRCAPLDAPRCDARSASRRHAGAARHAPRSGATIPTNENIHDPPGRRRDEDAEGRERLVPREVGGTEHLVRRTRDDPSLPASMPPPGTCGCGDVRPHRRSREPSVAGMRGPGNPHRFDTRERARSAPRAARVDAKRCEARDASSRT